MKKIISISVYLAILAFASIVFSCSPKSGDQAANPDADAKAVPSESHETEANRPTADIPGEMDLGGRDFTILYCDHPFDDYVQRDILVQEENGDIINDAVYKRNRTAEARLNCVIKEYVVPYRGVPAEIAKRVKANDMGIDASAIHLNQFGGLASQNMLIEYGSLPYIDLDKPWWDKNSVESLSIANKLFAACSDFLIYDKRLTNTMVFNKNLIADHALESPYDLVKSGNWTLDKLREMAKGISRDLDGNGIYDDNDRYGILYSADSLISFLNSCGEYIARKDENDRPYVTINSERAIDIIYSLFDFLKDETNCFHAQAFFNKTGEPYNQGYTRMFQEDKALFMSVYINDVENLRGMDTDFGIIPLPKYNKQQNQYYSNVNAWTGTAIVFLQSCPNPKESSAVIEDLSCEGKYVLQPVYYDVCLNTKLTRDEESGEMLDIIFNNRIYDNGDIYDFGGIANSFISMSYDYSRDFISMFEKSENKIQKDIDKLIENFEASE